MKNKLVYEIFFLDKSQQLITCDDCYRGGDYIYFNFIHKQKKIPFLMIPMSRIIRVDLIEYWDEKGKNIMKSLEGIDAGQ